MIPWEIHAIQVTNCNCDYGCPCQFNALPTYGTCEAAEGIKINKGFYGDVSLDGLTVAMIASGPDLSMRGMVPDRSSLMNRLMLNKGKVSKKF